MKLKGIHPLEANADKITLGVVGLALAGAAGLAFIAPGNSVKVGTQSDLPLAAAFDPVERSAQELQRLMDSAEPTKPTIPSFDLSKKVTLGPAMSIVSPLDAGRRLALGSAPNLGKVDVGGLPAAAVFGVPVVPAPSEAIAAAFSSTISPAEVIRYAGLAAVLPQQQPFDKAAVSVEASFDGAALRASLETDPDGDGPMEPLPLGWWREGAGGDQVEIVAVEWERELVAGPDGLPPQSPEVVAMKPAPGGEDWLGSWNEAVKSLGDMPIAIERWKAEREFVQRPAYYETIAGPAWKRPAEAATVSDDTSKNEAQMRRLRRDLDAAIADLEKARQELGQAPAGPRPGERGERSGDQGGAGQGGGGKGGPSGRPQAPTPNPNDRTPNRQALERKVKNLEEKRDRIAAALRKLDAAFVMPGDVAAPAPGETAVAAKAPSTLETGDLHLWTHDVTAVSGATYRYRARVVVNNPMYGRNLQESQRNLAEASVIRSAWGAWSEPVVVDQHAYFFVTSAEDRSQISPRPWATAELYEFYYGHYRNVTVRAEPGDVIAGEAKIPELKLADMDKLRAAIEAGKPLTAAPTPTTRPGDSPEPSRPRTGRGAVGTPDWQPPTDRDGRGAAPGATGGTGATPAASEFFTIEAPKERALSADAVMLDVLPLPQGEGDTRRSFKVLVMDPSGLIRVKVPAGERDSGVYKRVRASAEAGEKQGQIEVPVTQPTGPRVPPRDPTRPAAPKPPGGGGG